MVIETLFEMGQQKENQIAFMGDRRAFATDILRDIKDILPDLIRLEPAMDINEAARFLKCSPRHLETLVADGLVPFQNIGIPGCRRTLRFYKHDLAAWAGTEGMETRAEREIISRGKK